MMVRIKNALLTFILVLIYSKTALCDNVLLAHYTPIHIEVSNIFKVINNDGPKHKLWTIQTTNEKEIYSFVNDYNIDHTVLFGWRYCKHPTYTKSNIIVTTQHIQCVKSKVLRNTEIEKLINFFNHANLDPNYYLLASDFKSNDVLHRFKKEVSAEVFIIENIIELRSTLRNINLKNSGVVINGITLLEDEIGKILKPDKVNMEIATWNIKHLDVSLSHNKYTAISFGPNPFAVGKVVGHILNKAINGENVVKVIVDNVIGINQYRINGLGYNKIFVLQSGRTFLLWE